MRRMILRGHRRLRSLEHHQVEWWQDRAHDCLDMHVSYLHLHLHLRLPGVQRPCSVRLSRPSRIKGADDADCRVRLAPRSQVPDAVGCLVLFIATSPFRLVGPATRRCDASLEVSWCPGALVSWQVPRACRRCNQWQTGSSSVVTSVARRSALTPGDQRDNIIQSFSVRHQKVEWAPTAGALASSWASKEFPVPDLTGFTSGPRTNTHFLTLALALAARSWNGGWGRVLHYSTCTIVALSAPAKQTPRRRYQASHHLSRRDALRYAHPQ
jgi:hypothetical protein